ncbi:MAG: hypothetical protein WAT39_01860 [Planctomycetota bacterium]
MKIRSIKPEFWQNEKLATRCSLGARLLFAGLWGMADDHGRFRAHQNLIQGEVFPYEPGHPIADWLDELVTVGSIRLYQHAGQRYGLVVSFCEHQKIDKRWASRLPPPPDEPAPAPPAPSHETCIAPTPAAPVVTGDHQPSPGDARDETSASTGTAPVSTDSPDHTENVASLASEPARNGPKSLVPRLAEKPASLAEQSGGLASFSPTDRNGSDRKGTEPLRRARAREGSIEPGRAEPERGPEQAIGGTRSRRVEPPPRIRELQLALIASPYRSAIQNQKDRERVLLAKAADLASTGLTPAFVKELFEIDLATPNREGPPGTLGAHWLDKNLWREVIDAEAMKARERGLQARPKPDPTLDGVYGSEPKPAGSIAADVMKAATGGEA